MIPAILIGAHGSGLNFTRCLCSHTEGILPGCYLPNSTSLKEFITKPTNKKKLLMLDNSTFCIGAGGKIKFPIIKSAISDNLLLFINERDPIAILLSMINSIVFTLVRIASGLYPYENVSSSLIYKFYNIKCLLKQLILSPNLMALPYLIDKFSQLSKDIHFFSTQDWTTENALKSLNMIETKLGLPLTEYMNIPAASCYSRYNRYISRIMKLILIADGKEYLYVPYPNEFIDFFYVSPKYKTVSISQDYIPFNVGRFSGDYSFIYSGPADSLEKANTVINQNMDIVYRYLEELNCRNETAESMAKGMCICANDLYILARTDSELRQMLIEYLSYILSVYLRFKEQGAHHWPESMDLLRSLLHFK